MGLRAVRGWNPANVAITGGTSQWSNGTVGSPSIAWAADADGTGTGLFRSAANEIAFAINGVQRVTFGAQVTVGMNLLPEADNTRNFGLSGTKWLGVYASTYSTSAPVTETAATHTVATSTSHLICNRAGTITVTLPAASSFTGRQLYIRTIQAQLVVSDASNVVPRVGGAAGTAILGAVDGAWVLLVSDGTNWETMAGS